MKGGSALFTAKSVSVGAVSCGIAREWGEALWTAPALADAEFQRLLSSVAARRLILG